MVTSCQTDSQDDNLQSFNICARDKQVSSVCKFNSIKNLIIRGTDNAPDDRENSGTDNFPDDIVKSGTDTSPND